MIFTKNNLNGTLLVPHATVISSRQRWHVDARGKTLGKLAVEIAYKLQGKHKSSYTDFWDAGDYVIVTNADKIVVTGNKLSQKVYYRHSGHKGHLKETNLQDMLTKKPTEAIILAVKGMLPKNKLRNHRLKRLKTYAGEAHPYKVTTLHLECK